MAKAFSIGELEKARRDKGLTGTALARRMGIARSTVSEVERGVRTPTSEFKQRAAEALDTTAERLFPAFYILRADLSCGTLIPGNGWGRLFAFKEWNRAQAAAGKLGGLEVIGPIAPNLVALVVGTGQDQIESVMALDPVPEELSELSVSCAKRRGRGREPNA